MNEPISARIADLDWQDLSTHLDAAGYATLPSLLTAEECQTLTAHYEDATLFRSRVMMARHNFGRGEYQYFDYLLPDMIVGLRSSLFAGLALIANRWNQVMGIDVRYPDEHTAYREICHRAGQVKPTPLLLKYGVDDFNCLHQDLYGELVFPMQATILLSMPGQDFTGGEFILTEQRPRMQSRAEIAPLSLGDCVVFPVRQRPVQGTRGTYRVNMRHGVSRIRAGQRYALGIIFHDAA
tara:strand:+ start:2758 stop:3471 length:714 start_codon:yes stop_codon:yes gene_type:complete